MEGRTCYWKDSVGTIYCLTFTPSCVYSFIHFLSHSSLSICIHLSYAIFIPSFLYLFIYTIHIYSSLPIFINLSHPIFIPSYIHSSLLIFIHSSLPIFIHPFLYSFIHPFLYSFIPPFLYSFIRPFLYSFIPSYIHSSLPIFVHPFLYSLSILSFITYCNVFNDAFLLSKSVFFSFSAVCSAPNTFLFTWWTSCANHEASSLFKVSKMFVDPGDSGPYIIPAFVPTDFVLYSTS